MRAIVVAPLSPNTMPTASFVANASPPTPSLRGCAHALVTKTRFARDTKTFKPSVDHTKILRLVLERTNGEKGLSIQPQAACSIDPICFPRELVASPVCLLAVRVERAGRVETSDENLIQFENRVASRRASSPAALGCGRADSTSPPRIRRPNSFLGGVIDSALPLCDSVRSSVVRRLSSISHVL